MALELANRRLFWPIVILGVSACAARPDANALIDRSVSTPHRRVMVITATDRLQDHTGNGYTDERAPRMRFERFTLATPVTTKARASSRSWSPSNLAKRLTVIGRETIGPEDIGRATDTLVYVHGYNNSFQEALFQLAHVAEKGKLTETPILFSWPSKGSATAYFADKEAAIYARDDLVRLLGDLEKHSKDKKLTLFGHSMGAWIVVEALRQLKLSGRDNVLRSIDHVVLAAPDIDVDLFKRQVETIGSLRHPILVLSSRDDRALALSSRLGGSRDRFGLVGLDNDAARKLTEERKIQLLDLARLPSSDKTNHTRFIELIKILSKSRTNKQEFLAGLDFWRLH